MPQMGPTSWLLIIILSWMILLMMYFSLSSAPLMKPIQLPSMKMSPMLWEW